MQADEGDEVNTREAWKLAVVLMAQHGLDGWRCKWTNGKRTFGVCKFNSRIIGLSKPMTLLNDEQQVRDTILHEIAHALAGPKAKHGPVWKLTCIRIGATPNPKCGAETTAVAAPFEAICPTCNEPRARRYRRSTKRLFCSPCMRAGKKPEPVVWRRTRTTQDELTR